MNERKNMYQEFKPTIFFLIKFIGIYMVGNLLYGWYVTAWHPRPDPMTQWVTEQSSIILNAMGWETTTQNQLLKPTTNIVMDNQAILAVYEGCNGLNVVIVFLAFLFAFGPFIKSMKWFVPLGLVVIHISNLLRIILLFWVSVQLPDFMYFAHKYLFTAFIYLFVFLLWIWWVLKIGKQNPHVEAA